MNLLNPQAEALNAQIQENQPAVLDMLSARGRGIFFPTQGILAQTAEAKGKEIDATIGIALEENGSPMAFSVLESWVLKPRSAVMPYAPSYGKPELRKVWLEKMRQKNPSLSDKPVSMPVVTCALTHGLSLCGYLFLDPGERLILPDMNWENYGLIFQNGFGVELDTYNTFKGNGLDLQAFEHKIKAHAGDKLVVLLNFPNNPAGYTPTEVEARRIQDILVQAAESGKRVVVIHDDAYFGLVYQDGIMRESLFAGLCDAHSNLLAVKLDGATKEDFVWGYRVGFITYGIQGGNPRLYSALEQKTGGAVRGTISNAPHISQSLLCDLYQHPDYEAMKAEKFQILEGRCRKVQQILADHPEYKEFFEALPFNSGYFMCVRLKGLNAETVRKRLLEHHATGLISQGNDLRIAFSATPTHLLEPLFDRLYRACGELRSGAA